MNNFIYVEPFSWSILVCLILSRPILVQLCLSWSISIYHCPSLAILSYPGPFFTKIWYFGLSQAISSYHRLSLAISGFIWIKWAILAILIKYQGASRSLFVFSHEQVLEELTLLKIGMYFHIIGRFRKHLVPWHSFPQRKLGGGGRLCFKRNELKMAIMYIYIFFPLIQSNPKCMFGGLFT